MNQSQNKNWWGRNWIWCVSLGCLGMLVLFLGVIALIVSLVFGMMKSSDAYKLALEQVQASPIVQEVIGSPIEANLFISGSINLVNESGHADLFIPITGPNGDGVIHAIAEKSVGKWTFTTLEVEVTNTKQTIDLLE